MIVVLTFTAAVVSIMQTLALPMVPLLPELLDTDLVAASWVATASTLVGALANPLLGRAGDLYGKRRALLLALSLLLIGSVLCSAAPNLGVLVAGRALQGAAVGAIALGVGLVKDVLPIDAVARGTTAIGATMGIGGGLGVPLSGFLVEHVDWHAVFWVATGLSFAALMGVLVIVPESPRRAPGGFDVIGALGLTSLTVLLLLPVTYSTSWGYADPRFWGCFLGVVVLGAPWTVQQLRSRSPLTDLRVMSRPPVAILHVIGLLVGFSMFGNFASTLQVVVFDTDLGGLGATLMVAGLVMLPVSLISPLMVWPSTWVTRRRGSRTMLLAGLCLALAGTILRLTLPPGLVSLTLGYSLIQLGTSFAFASLPLLLSPHIPVEQTGGTNGFSNLCRQIGSSVGNAVNAAVIGAALVTGTAAAVHTGLLALHSAIGAAVLLAAILALFTSRTAGRAPARLPTAVPDATISPVIRCERRA